MMVFCPPWIILQTSSHLVWLNSPAKKILWASYLTKLILGKLHEQFNWTYSAHSLASNWQMPSLNQQKSLRALNVQTGSATPHPHLARSLISWLNTGLLQCSLCLLKTPVNQGQNRIPTVCLYGIFFHRAFLCNLWRGINLYFRILLSFITLLTLIYPTFYIL